ncbi:cysteine hydrolase [Fervidobacterium thailandense]|uniref:Cysteine hydrolase n=1 Tax=Fervidobacterium thailandense TaxID=1008305 RepID=A0A1E3G2E7_9BACT|nr:cysteine hydrolase [Fervidobacterium thailandense]
MFYLERQKHPLRRDLLVDGKAVLLLIDVQSYFFNPNSPAYLRGVERVLLNIVRLLEVVKRANIPIIATIHSGGSDNMRRWWNNTVDEPWTTLAVDNKLVDYLVTKNTYDAFFSTNLDDLLKSLKSQVVLISGVMTHLCCETTARSAFVRGYDVVMIEDCLWDKDEWYHYASLRNLAHGFAVISNLGEIERLIQEVSSF